jgi:hypothetical protein
MLFYRDFLLAQNLPARGRKTEKNKEIALFCLNVYFYETDNTNKL